MSLVARLSLVAAVLSGAVLVVLPSASFAADTYHVDVVDDAYDDGNRDGNADEENEEPNRNHTVITAGDAVVWQWIGDNQHTVTSHPSSERSFDSDSECAEQEDRTECRTKGNVFVVRFEEPGTYRYLCKFHSDPVTGLTGMVGTIEVQAPEPSESDGGSEPSSEPTSEQASSEPQPSESEPESSPEPQEEPSESPTPDDRATGSQDGDTTEPDTADDRPPPRQATGPGFGVQRQPERSGGPRPEVAPETAPAPTFSPFPTAPDLPSESETDDMAVTVPGRDSGGPSRGVVVGVAVASLIGSAGAFGKVVLFGRPWG